jgi:hypothetical protein
MIHEQFLEYNPSELEIPNPLFQEQYDAQLKLIRETPDDDDKFELVLGIREIKETKNPWSRETYIEWLAESTEYQITGVEFGEHLYAGTGSDVFEVTVYFDDSIEATYEENLEIVNQQMIMNSL